MMHLNETRGSVDMTDVFSLTQKSEHISDRLLLDTWLLRGV
jgi:hypothetical protein